MHLGILVPKQGSHAQCLETHPPEHAQYSCAICIWPCVQPGLQAQRLRIPGEHPWAPKPCFYFSLQGGTSPIPHFLKLQNGFNELTSVGLMFAFTSTDEKCDMRSAGDCYCQRATYLHWKRIGCIQQRGLGLRDEFFAWEHAWNEKDLCGTLSACMAKAIPQHRQFPANCISFDVQPPFPVSYMWWFCTASIAIH